MHTGAQAAKPVGTAPAAAQESGHAESRPSARKERGPDHYGNVLFLSADNKFVYAYIGVLKALEEYGLQPDAVLAESKAVIVGAAWALGYDAAGMEKEMQHKPLEAYLRPLPVNDKRGGPFLPYGPDPLQWDIPLGLQSLQTSGSQWNDVQVGEAGEYLHLSWLVARLTHDAPGGPVEELSGTPRPLAVQVSDLVSGKPAVLTEGNLQWILKGSLLPANVVRQRPRLWPYASGSLLSGHTAMAENLPFTCDRLILIKPGRRLRPAALEAASLSWTDSLQLRAKTMLAEEGEGRNGSSLGGERIMAIDLEPEGEFDPEESDPRLWINLGYTSALRSMDILRSVLAKGKEEPAQQAKPAEEEKLGLNRLSVNPLASGGRQLLLDILQNSESAGQDSGSDEAISALVESGYYTDLDVDWSKATREDKALLIFDAKEKSKILFRAGYNYTYTGEELTDRSPEGYAGLSWSEPFYIPFQAEAALLLGGHRPGYEGRALIAPVYPLHMELGLTRTHWEMDYPFTATTAAQRLGADYFRINRTLSEVFLTLFPIPSAYLRTAIQKHEMERPAIYDDGEPSFLSTDFQETAFMGLGKKGAGGYPHSLRIAYRNLNRVNTIGKVRYANSNIESRLRLSLGDFRFTDQYYWSDGKPDVTDPYDLMETGRIDAFTFENEYFLRFLRSQNFQDFRIEYAPVFGKAGLRLIAGAFRNYGQVLFAEQADYKTFRGKEVPYRAHWEAQAGYQTPLGTVRLGMGGLDDAKPFYYFRIGTGFELGFDKDD